MDSERDAVVKTDDLRRVERLRAVVAPLIAELTAAMMLVKSAVHALLASSVKDTFHYFYKSKY